MTDFDSIWRTQDEIRTVVNAVLGESFKKYISFVFIFDCTAKITTL